MQINKAVNGFVWGPVMLVLLVGTGVYLSIAVGFIQFTKIGYWWKNTIGKIFKKGEAGDGEITPLQAVSTALASTVGTGNIAGVTGAIILGGPGAVFWMWVISFFGMATIYAEATLAQETRIVDEDGSIRGGPVYYITTAFKGRFGKFLACPNFPECRNTKAIVEKINVPCPKCGAALIKRKTKRGKVFYGCEKYPECDFVSWDMPSGENCPKCGAIMVNKVGPRGKYVACSNKDCGYIERSVKKGTENDVEK